ncbi:MAG: protein kinase [Candidatus Schekmanbacteria bacterium]|nr:protein kinase [Candidatus Schekmanbacteria bacterium]
MLGGGKRKAALSRIGPYVLEDRLGEGGMAEVFRCRHEATGERFAAKIPHDDCDESWQMRFHREWRIALRLAETFPRHGGFVKAHEVIEIGDGRHGLIMELVEGGDVKTYFQSLRGREELGFSEKAQLALELIRQTLVSLDLLHREGLIHRDLKPSNLLVSRSGEVKLADFGLAGETVASDYTIITVTGDVLGTPSHCSPEQFGDPHKVGPASDLYSVGCVLFDLLAGRPPFCGNLWQVRAGHLGQPAPRVSTFAPECPAELDAWVAALLEKEPQARPRSAAELLRSLQTVVACLARRHAGVAPTQPLQRLGQDTETHDPTEDRRRRSERTEVADPGRLAHRYQISELIGSGGMGAVFRAVDRATGGNLVLKLPHPWLLKDDEMRRRWDVERSVLETLELPGIPRLLDHGPRAECDVPFIAMELVSGLRIDRHCARLEGAPAPGRAPTYAYLREVARLAIRLCRILVELHRHGILHRDVKPANIIVTNDDRPVLIDFGIAGILPASDPNLTQRQTSPGWRMGSPRYQAREAMESLRSASQDSDIQSLGLTLYELATGVPVIDRDARPRHHHEDFPEELEEIIVSMLATQRERWSPIKVAARLGAFFGLESLVEAIFSRAALTYLKTPPSLAGHGEPDRDASSALTAMRGLLSAAPPQVLVLSGPRGGGKTRLVRQLRTEAAASSRPAGVVRLDWRSVRSEKLSRFQANVRVVAFDDVAVGTGEERRRLESILESLGGSCCLILTCDSAAAGEVGAIARGITGEAVRGAALPPLSEEETARLVSSLLGGDTAPAGLFRAAYARSRGIPGAAITFLAESIGPEPGRGMLSRGPDAAWRIDADE